MAKKGGQAQIQIEVRNDDEWEMLLNRPGLIVVDVHLAWCGPCTGMFGNIKKVRLESGSDLLTLAVACADTITPLAKFRGHCEPTWMFIANNKVLKVLWGLNAPLLMKDIIYELELETLAIESEVPQDRGVDISEFTPEEEVKFAEFKALEDFEKNREIKEYEDRVDAIKRLNLERYARAMVYQSIVVVFPHLIKEPDENNNKRVCQAAYRLMVLYDNIKMGIYDQLDVQLTEEMLDELFYDSNYHDIVTENMKASILERPVMANMLQHHSYNSWVAAIEERAAKEAAAAEEAANPQPPPTGKKKKAVVEEEEEDVPIATVDELMGNVEDDLLRLIFGEGKNPAEPSEDSVAAFWTVDKDEERWPPFYVPQTTLAKANAIKLLFPNYAEALNITEEVITPPSYVMIFEGTKAREVLDAAEVYKDEVLHVGYFDSIFPETAQRVANTLHELERLGPSKMAEAKMVIALEKKRSEPMLNLAQHGPIYMSHDVRQGTREVDIFFPRSVDIVQVPDPFHHPSRQNIEPDVIIDEFGNAFVEIVEEVDGETKITRKLIKRADGLDLDSEVPLPGSGDEPAEDEDGDGKKEEAAEEDEEDDDDEDDEEDEEEEGE